MYATIQIRETNPERWRETGQDASSDFFPELERAHGFVAFYVVAQEDGSNAAITFWQNQAQAKAFRQADASWSLTLERHGHRLVSDHGGEVITQLRPRA
jgi:heme-degrading monooxygenase HmoA